jgi:FtsH-binding integral membrane protein
MLCKKPRGSWRHRAPRTRRTRATRRTPLHGCSLPPLTATGPLPTRTPPTTGGNQAPPGYPTMPVAGPSFGAPPPQQQQQQGYPQQYQQDDKPGKQQAPPAGYGGAGYPGAGAPPPFMMPPMIPMQNFSTAAQDPEAQAMQDDMAFASIKVRNGFVRKVFGIVALQLLFTAGVAAACIYVPEIKGTIRRNPWMFYMAWGVSFAIMLGIACESRGWGAWAGGRGGGVGGRRWGHGGLGIKTAAQTDKAGAAAGKHDSSAALPLCTNNAPPPPQNPTPGVEKLRRTYPLNVFMLGLFTLAEAYLVGCITAFYDQEAVMIAFGVTAAAVVGLTIFAMNTKVRRLLLRRRAWPLLRPARV